jgi:uncharacterized protein YndB with AHSA1/START domain
MSTTTNALTVNAPAGVPFVDTVREFDFPVEAVYRAHVDPTLVIDWLGPRGYVMDLERWDIVSGGGWSYVHRSDDGEFGFRGVVHTARENDFLLQTFEFLGAPDQVSIESATFEELPGGRSRVSVHATYPSIEARNGMVDNGMAEGMGQGYDRLEELLAGQ